MAKFNVGRGLESGLQAASEVLRSQLTLEDYRNQQEQERIERAFRERAMRLQERNIDLSQARMELERQLAERQQRIEEENRRRQEMELARANEVATVAFNAVRPILNNAGIQYPENFTPTLPGVIALIDVLRDLDGIQKSGGRVEEGRLGLIAAIGSSLPAISVETAKALGVPFKENGAVDVDALKTMDIAQLTLVAGSVTNAAQKKGGMQIMMVRPGETVLGVGEGKAFPIYSAPVQKEREERLLPPGANTIIDLAKILWEEDNFDEVGGVRVRKKSYRPLSESLNEYIAKARDAIVATLGAGAGEMSENPMGVDVSGIWEALKEWQNQRGER